MALTESRVLTRYVADTSQEQRALDDLISKVNKLKATEEAAANSREQHFDQLVLDLTRASRGVEETTVTWDGWGKTSHGVKGKVEETTGALGKMTAKLALANVVFGDLDKVAGFVTKGIGMLGANMSSTAKATVDAAAKGAQMGLVFGPLGAAIGGAGGALGEFTAKLYDNGEHALVMKFYDGMIAQSERLSTIYKQIKTDLDNWTSSVEKLRNAQEQSNRELLDAATNSLAYGQQGANQKVNTLRIAYLTEKRQRESFGLTAPTDQELLISRQLRDAMIEQATAAKSYGEEVAKIRLDEQHRYDAIANLNKALADGVITQKQYNKALAEANKEGYAAAQLAAAQARARGLLRGATMDYDLDNTSSKSLSDVNRALQGIAGRTSLGEKADDAYRDKYGFERDTQALLDQHYGEQSKANFGKGLGAIAKQGSKQKKFLEEAFGSVDDFKAHAEAFNMLSGAVSSSVNAWITGSESVGTAFKKAIGASLTALSSQMAVEALKHSAYALGSLAFGDVRGAGQHAIAAAQFGAGAAAAAVAAKSLGGGGASVDGRDHRGAESAGRGGGGSVNSAGMGGGDHRLGGSNSQRPIIFVLGEQFGHMDARQRQLEAEKKARRAFGAAGFEDS